MLAVMSTCPVGITCCVSRAWLPTTHQPGQPAQGHATHLLSRAHNVCRAAAERRCTRALHAQGTVITHGVEPLSAKCENGTSHLFEYRHIWTHRSRRATQALRGKETPPTARSGRPSAGDPSLQSMPMPITGPGVTGGAGGVCPNLKSAQRSRPPSASTAEPAMRKKRPTTKRQAEIRRGLTKHIDLCITAHVKRGANSPKTRPARTTALLRGQRTALASWCGCESWRERAHRAHGH
jgi:hypothetical protein